jgi:hypothetical protein
VVGRGVLWCGVGVGQSQALAYSPTHPRYQAAAKAYSVITRTFAVSNYVHRHQNHQCVMLSLKMFGDLAEQIAATKAAAFSENK